ncbi:hypothetical protein K474DRAFT_1243932 [Panus rudis PR-1116 ss-1]|nr:hypothetical protein K474DRAFT_1243932 [Panus rudis PR-1116 ss-1]
MDATPDQEVVLGLRFECSFRQQELATRIALLCRPCVPCVSPSGNCLAYPQRTTAMGWSIAEDPTPIITIGMFGRGLCGTNFSKTLHRRCHARCLAFAKSTDSHTNWPADTFMPRTPKCCHLCLVGDVRSAGSYHFLRSVGIGLVTRLSCRSETVCDCRCLPRTAVGLPHID